MSFPLALLLLIVACGRALKFFHTPELYARKITVYRNGGNNTECGAKSGASRRRASPRFLMWPPRAASRVDDDQHGDRRLCVL